MVHYPLPRTVNTGGNLPRTLFMARSLLKLSVEIEIVLAQPLSIRPYIQSVNIRKNIIRLTPLTFR